MRMRALATALVSIGMLSAASSASALTLGTTTPPSGASPQQCTPAAGSGVEIVQTATDGAFDYTVPSGGGLIASWSFDTTGVTPGTSYGLLVVRPEASGLVVVGSDVETIPASPPATETFTLATPLPVDAGDELGALIEPGSTAHCLFTGAPSADTVSSYDASATTPGAALGASEGTSTGLLLNMSVNLEQQDDAGITAQALPKSVVAGGAAAFSLAVAAALPEPATVTDTVPAGLSVLTATADNGTCSTLGQTVDCSLTTTPSTISIVVSGLTPGTYTDLAAVSGDVSDPNSANNNATAALDVTAAGTAAACHPVSLTGIPLAQAKRIINALGCAVGKQTKKSSKTIPKGDVVSTTPSSGTKPLATKLAIVVSSGKPKPKHHKKH
jgi:hypothetical protein